MAGRYGRGGGLVMIPLPSAEATVEDLGAPIVTLPSGEKVQDPADVNFGAKVLGFGDSVGFTTAFNTDLWLQNNTNADFTGHAALGCGTVTEVALQVARVSQGWRSRPAASPPRTWRGSSRRPSPTW